MVDQLVRAQLGGRAIGKAEAHRHHRHACRPRRVHIGDRIADEHRGKRLAPGRRNGREHMAGIRLGKWHRIKTQVGGKAPVPAQCRHQRARERHRLVGADGEGAAFRRQRIQRRLHAIEGPRANRDIGAVELQEVRHPGFHQFRRHRTGSGQPALQQPARAMADHVAHILRRHAGAAQLLQRMVERGAQVWRGIDERAVKIEDYGGGK